MCVVHQSEQPTNDSFPTEMDAQLNRQAVFGWTMKQIVQFRANRFLIVFEKPEPQA